MFESRTTTRFLAKKKNYNNFPIAMAKPKNAKRPTSDLDLALALELQQQYNPVGITENAVFPNHRNKENYQPRTLIDQTLEIIDPTPNIYTLFIQFNSRFFSNKLLSVEVKWSKRMTSCAGVCSFHPRSRDCVISLSAPLLKLRPRKDLVETLLHEMIHGYLFLTNNNRDRDGHGPEFCKHMDRINKEAGTHITIYHSFHDEVKLYQQHWWRCDGPCQKQHPYFGMVRRAMNRAPGPSDFWWKSHQQRCGGVFVKVKEPDETKQKSKSQKKTIEDKKNVDNTSKLKNHGNLNDFFAKPKSNDKPKASTSSTVGKKSTGVYQPVIDNSNSRKNYPANPPKAVPAGLVKLGTATNNVHGWGTGGPGSNSNKSQNPSQNNSTNVNGNSKRPLNFTGTLGGLGTGRSNLLDKFSSSPPIPDNRLTKNSIPTIIPDSPVAKKRKIPGSSSNDDDVFIIDSTKNNESCDCPICGKSMAQSRLNDHLDVCLMNDDVTQKIEKSTVVSSTRKKISSIIEIVSSPETPERPRKPRDRIPVTSTPLGQTTLDGYVTSPKKNPPTNHVCCPVCEKSLEIDELNEHLDVCLSSSNNVSTKKPTKIRGPSAGPSVTKKRDSIVDLTDEKIVGKDFYVCLVCNEKINVDVDLNDHLDDCVGSIFSDDSIDVEYNDSVKSSSPESTIPTNAEFPCPICLVSIPEKNMNRHLDDCLSGEKWD